MSDRLRARVNTLVRTIPESLFAADSFIFNASFCRSVESTANNIANKLPIVTVALRSSCNQQVFATCTDRRCANLAGSGVGRKGANFISDRLRNPIQSESVLCERNLNRVKAEMICIIASNLWKNKTSVHFLPLNKKLSHKNLLPLSWAYLRNISLYKFQVVPMASQSPRDGHQGMG